MSLVFNSQNWGDDDSLFEELKKTVTNVLGPSLRARNIPTVTMFSRIPYFKPITEPRNFNIFVNVKAHERDEEILRIPQRMWGIEIEMCDRCNVLHEPSGDGLIITEPNGYAVAEIIGNCLYILFNVCNSNHLNQREREKLQSQILQEAISFLGKPFPSIQDMLSGKFEIPDREVLKQLSKTKETELAKRRLARNVINAGETLSRIQNVKIGMVARSLIQKILCIPEIHTVKIDGWQLIVKTHTMYASHPTNKRIYELGRFQIEFGLGQRANANFHNLDRHPYKDGNGEYGHPHVERGGNHWCKGEGSGIIDLLREFEIEAAIVFSLRAIESVNEDRDGNYLRVLESFPTAKERQKYPTKKEIEVSERTVVEFSKIFDGSIDRTRTTLEENLKALRLEIVKDQNIVFCGTFYRNIDGLCQGTPEEMGDKVSTYIKKQTTSLQQLPQVDKIEIERDVAKIRFLNAPNLREISINYATGSVDYKAPNGKNFELPIGQLQVTVPELLGGFDFETAISMILECINKN